MTIQEAINKAVKSGWDCGKLRSFDGVECLDEAEVCLDPSFWQALGKSMGWGIEPSGSIWQGEEKWKIRWHRLIDKLAEGGTIEQFFNEL